MTVAGSSRFLLPEKNILFTNGWVCYNISMIKYQAPE